MKKVGWSTFSELWAEVVVSLGGCESKSEASSFAHKEPAQHNASANVWDETKLCYNYSL